MPLIPPGNEKIKVPYLLIAWTVRCISLCVENFQFSVPNINIKFTNASNVTRLSVTHTNTTLLSTFLQEALG